MESSATLHPQDGSAKPLAHVVDVRVLLAVFAALIVLTAITVAVSYFQFGPFNLIVAMGVATIKAALVALWFMHLRYDSGLNAFIFLVGIAFLGLFMVIAMLDSVEYRPNIQAWEQNKR
jgi:cytochrome c oxidase subunit 4